MNLIKIIVKLGALIALAALFLPGLFTPWREALYDLSEVEGRRQINSVIALQKGGMPDSKCMIGDSMVITWLPRDYEKTAEGEQSVCFKAFVAIDTPIESDQTPKLESVRIRSCENDVWTDLGTCIEYATETNDRWVTKYHELRLPKRFEPQEGTNVYVQVVVSATEKSNTDDSQHPFFKTFSYVFIPKIWSGRSELLHWFTSL